MSRGTRGDYWGKPDLSSRFEHTLLSTHIPRFGEMTGSRDGRADYRAKSASVCVHRGDVDGLLDDVVRAAAGLPLFLFLDP